VALFTHAIANCYHAAMPHKPEAASRGGLFSVSIDSAVWRGSQPLSAEWL
jgi:hypothetical protein